MTVKELIEQLQALPQDETVGVRASCCHHTHDIREIRQPGEYEDDHPEVVIDATDKGWPR